MSAAMAREAREANKRKAARLAGPGDDPSKKIDASGWKEPTDMHATAKTGMRPVSRRQFKSGGAVSGEHAKHRADRKARKNGGGVNAKINRDVRAANAELGKPHIGGFASGGAANFRKQMHGMMGVPENKHGRRNGVGKFERSHKAGGGPLADLLNEQADRKAMKPAIAPAPAMPQPQVMTGETTGLGSPSGEGEFKRGGRPKRASGGSTYADIAGMRPKGDRMPRKAGGKAKGKGKTQIIIGIHAGGAHQPPQGAPPMPHPAAPPPMPPPQMPPGGPPMGAGGPPGMMPPGMPMPRKLGGKVVGAKFADASIAKAEKTKSAKAMDVGAGGGLGRLAKSAIARRDGFRPV